MKILKIIFNWLMVGLMYIGLSDSPSLTALGKKPSDCIPSVDADGIS